MIYVFDSSTFIQIFRYYYPERFPSFWEQFEKFVSQGVIISTREVARELHRRENELKKWTTKNKPIFESPSTEELEFISNIYEVRHFQANIRKKNILQGHPVADPFVIAKARVKKGYVVSTEIPRKNSAKIPNICKHFHVHHMHLREFMKHVDWTF